MALSALVLALIVCVLTFRFLLRVAGLEESYQAAFPDKPDPDAVIARELGPRLPYELQEWIWVQLGRNGRLDAVSELIDPRTAGPGRRIHREGRVFQVDLSDLDLWRLEPLRSRSDRWSLRLDLDDNALCAVPPHGPWLDSFAGDWSQEQRCSPRQRRGRFQDWLKSLRGLPAARAVTGNNQVDSLFLSCGDSSSRLGLHLLAGAGLRVEHMEIAHCLLEREDIQFLSQLRVGELVLRGVHSPTLDLSMARGLERIQLDSGRIEWFVPPFDLETSGKDHQIRFVARGSVAVRGLRLEHPFARDLLAFLGIRGDPAATDALPASLEQAWILDSLWAARFGGQELTPSGDFDTIRLLLGDPDRRLTRVAGPVRPLQRPCPAPLGPNSHDPFYHSLMLAGPDIVRIPAGPEFAVGDFRYPLGKDTLRPGLRMDQVRKVLGKPAWVDSTWLGFAHRKPFSGKVTLYLWAHFDSTGALDGLRETPEGKEGC